MTNSRTKNTIKNIAVIVVMQILSFVYSLISKRLFLNEFSLSIYGVVDLFSSFFNSLMLLEMGFGTILIYNLYKPVAENNIVGIRKQLSVFKTIYFYISIIILSISLVALPFLYDIFNISYHDKLLIYEVYLSNIVYILFKYHFLNKTSIFDAGQYKYVSNIITIAVDFIVFVLKVLSVIVFNNLYLYMFAQLFLPSTSYWFMSKVIDKKYDVKDIKRATFKEVLESGALSQCRKYIYATIYSLVFSSMDNIIISMVLSTDAVAYTSNYYSLISTGWMAAVTVMSSIRGVLADYTNNVKDIDSRKDVFDLISSFNFIISSLLIVGFACLLDDFIALWVGSEYLIERNIMLALLISKTMDNLFEPINSMTVIEGYIFREKWNLIISALTNLILTIIFLYKFGLVGAYYATIIALIFKWAGKFYYVLSGVFKKYKFDIIKRYLIYIAFIGVEIYLIGHFASLVIPHVNSLVLFIYKFLIVVAIVCLINGITILFNKGTRDYIKHTLLRK